MGFDSEAHLALVDRLTRSLAQTSARPGMRLRSERELAQRLGIGRKRVAYAIGRLVKSGILVRRAGSGTFLKQVPNIENLSDVSSNPDTDESLISTEDLFDPRRTPGPRVKTTPQRRHLRLAMIWSNLSSSSQTNRLLLDGMLSRVRELGHELASLTTPLSGVTSRDPHLTDELAAELGKVNPDGVLVIDYENIVARANAALAALNRAAMPIAYFNTAQSVTPNEPRITFEIKDAIYRGIYELAREGYQRIGLICNARAGQVRDIYHGAMDQVGLSYRQYASRDYRVVHWIADGNVHVIPDERYHEDGFANMVDLLDRAQPPDAVYVNDDAQLFGVAQALAERGLKPGVDLGVVSLKIADKPLPAGVNWSYLEFDPRRLGAQAVNMLIEVLQDHGVKPPNTCIGSRWFAGETHHRR